MEKTVHCPGCHESVDSVWFIEEEGMCVTCVCDGVLEAPKKHRRPPSENTYKLGRTCGICEANNVDAEYCRIPDGAKFYMGRDAHYRCLRDV